MGTVNIPYNDSNNNNINDGDDDDDDIRSIKSVEIITDEEFDIAMGEAAKEVQQILEDEEIDLSEEEKDNLILDILLRSFDVTFFLIEKTLTVVPKAVQTGQIAAKRFDHVNRGGLGSKGWKRIGNARRGSNRY